MEAVVAQNSMMLQAMAAQRLGLSDGDGLGSAGESGSALGSRGAVALQAQRRVLDDRPESVTAEIRKGMATALGTSADSPQDSFEYVRRHGGFRNRTDVAHAMALVCPIWNALEVGDPETAHARCALALASLDQAARDGRWELAVLAGQAPEPPPEALARHPAKSLLTPQSPLMAPRWITAAQQYLRDSANTEKAFREYSKGRGKGKDKGAEKADV